jgi:[acyl-carrier-protein] S-malonyltransferase
MRRAFVFPGQGSQKVGMGKELFDAYRAARDVFNEVDEALGQDLSRLIFEGPFEELTLTENAQPALMATSLATVKALQFAGDFRLADHCVFVAGHSLGEYSALAAANGLSVSGAATLLRTRGRAMQEAAPPGAGAMIVLLGLGLDEARVVADEAANGGICTVANDNSPEQLVISGDRAAVEWAAAIAGPRGAKCIPLPVSAPFHCALMAPAAEVMKAALAGADIEEPDTPLVSNVSAHATRDVDEIRGLLVEQVTAMVRWRESVQFMRDQGVEGVVEVGAGKVLSGLARRIDSRLETTSIGTPREVEAFLEVL